MAQITREKRIFTYKPTYEQLDAIHRRVLEELQHDPRVRVTGEDWFVLKVYIPVRPPPLAEEAEV